MYICVPSLLNLSPLTSTLKKLKMGFSGGSDSKESACNEGDMGVIPGSGRSPGVGSGNSLRYSCLENSMDSGASRATVHGAPKNWT